MGIKGLKPLEAPEFLKWMAHDWPGLYILGSFNRHITVHSQQCRAVNLIQALMKEGVIEGKSVAIVGAGFAGLTAAAFALEKTTAQVTLFDAAPRPLWLQIHARTVGCIREFTIGRDLGRWSQGRIYRS